MIEFKAMLIASGIALMGLSVYASYKISKYEDKLNECKAEKAFIQYQLDDVLQEVEGE